jgi:hypothetical protein
MERLLRMGGGFQGFGQVLVFYICLNLELSIYFLVQCKKYKIL